MDFNTYVAGPIHTIQAAILVITVLLHLIFAGAVAKDAGKLNKDGIRTFLVSGITWAFATLIGGVFTAAIYWVIHRSNLTRVT